MKEILITIEPWVSGTRAAWYSHPPLSLNHCVRGKSWEEALDEILQQAAERARDVDANAIVGVEITCDPYSHDGATISLSGTIARLEALFGGPLEMQPWM